MGDYRDERTLASLGDNLRRWRKIRGLTAEMVAERAGIAPKTLRGIETGTGAARVENVVAVMRVLGIVDSLLEATEPLNTDLGRARAAQALPERVRVRRS
jgi:transcriptional regulator with XRE-family HTH domain